jgi:hypothetical protein
LNCDTNGNPVLGGAFWRPGTQVETGVVASVAGGVNVRTFTITGKAWTPNQYAGMMFVDTTTGTVGSNLATILSNGTNTLVCDQRFNPTVSDNFIIVSNRLTFDGHHPSQFAIQYNTTNGVYSTSLFPAF